MTKQKDRKTCINAGLAGAAGDVVSRYGSGVKEHVVAYGGVDNETGQTLKRSLKKISNYNRGNPDAPNYDRVTKSQAGFSAEVKEVARRRAEEVIQGKKPTTVRTDDIPGHMNDPLFDITSVISSNGDPISGASIQMKFMGSSPENAVDKMLGKSFQKYIDNNVKIMVPSDYYDGMKAELQKKIVSLEKKIERLKEQGKTDVLKQARLDKYKVLDKNLQKSKVSNKEALEARNTPRLSTAKDVLRTGHRAGIKQAKTGAVIGGGMSLIRNFAAVCQGKKSKEDAALEVVGDTAGAAVLSYTIAFGGAVIKGTAQNSASSYIRVLSKTNLPAYIATATLEVGKTLKSYFSGNIDGVQCLEELGEKGYGTVNSAMFAALGQVAIPIPVVGALSGAMLGYALSSASYQILLEKLKEAKHARKERKRIEKECAEAIEMLREYRMELGNNIQQFLKEEQQFFDQTFDRIKSTLRIGDVDGYISITNELTESFGKEPLYRNMPEFDSVMGSDEPIVF